MKVCSRCSIEKDDSQFRLRYDKRGKGSKGLKYLNNTCRQCDAEISNRHYFKNKDNENFRQQWLKKSNDYYHTHREEIMAKMKLKRQTSEYKKMMREYRKNNKEKIYKQEVITKKRYSDKHRDALTDQYIGSRLEAQGLAVNPEIIQAKRLQILIQRKIKQHD